jgi:uncharacterized protein (TIGR02452 family)
VTTFTGQIPREEAIQFGRESVQICEEGHYVSSAGVKVNIQSQIDDAVRGTRSYAPDVPIDAAANGAHATVIQVVNETTLSAGRRLLDAGLNPVVLNFASATEPGGGFQRGARAQEEYLARSSCLYECIRQSPMYAFHRAHYDPLYSDYLVYSPRVPIIRDDNGKLRDSPYPISIITCAAVNAKELEPGRLHEIGPAMARRIERVLAAGLAHAHDSIVLGAWGCGAFGNDGHEIAALFYASLHERFAGAYGRVIFAIVDWSPEHRFIGPFEKVFAAKVF